MNELSLNYLFVDQTIRTVVTLAETWFVLKDVCDALGIVNSRNVYDRLDDDEKADVCLADTSSNGVVQRRNYQAVNESGLYDVIVRSDSPKAKPFRRWITHEVLPSIRKQGFYSLMSDEDLVVMLTERQKRNPKALDCIDKQKIKQSITNEKREAALPIIREAWRKRFIEKDKSVDFQTILRTHTMGDSAMYHKYYDKYMSAYNRELRGWEVKELE